LRRSPAGTRDSEALTALLRCRPFAQTTDCKCVYECFLTSQAWAILRKLGPWADYDVTFTLPDHCTRGHDFNCHGIASPCGRRHRPQMPIDAQQGWLHLCGSKWRLHHWASVVRRRTQGGGSEGRRRQRSFLPMPPCPQFLIGADEERLRAWSPLIVEVRQCPSRPWARGRQPRRLELQGANATGEITRNKKHGREAAAVNVKEIFTT
jgi:hypothetical protein